MPSPWEKVAAKPTDEANSRKPHPPPAAVPLPQRGRLTRCAALFRAPPRGRAHAASREGKRVKTLSVSASPSHLSPRARHTKSGRIIFAPTRTWHVSRIGGITKVFRLLFRCLQTSSAFPCGEGAELARRMRREITENNPMGSPHPSNSRGFPASLFATFPAGEG